MLRTSLQIIVLTVLVTLVLTGCDILLFGDGGPAGGPGTDSVTDTDTDTTGAEELSGTISEDITLSDRISDPATADYLVGDDVTVRAALTIEAGVVMAFASDALLTIEDSGSIQATGTASNPVVFTGQTETPGFWRGVLIESTNVTNALEHVRIEYAGSSTVDGNKAGLTLDDYYDGKVGLTSVTVSNTDGYGVVAGTGTVFTAFAGNTFSGNAGAPLLVHPDNVHRLDTASSYATGNGVAAVEVFGGTFTEGGSSASWPSLGIPYRVLDDLTVRTNWYIDAGVVLELASDVLVRIDDLNAASDAGIVAVGSSGAPIVFTGVTKISGFWQGILVESNAVTNEMDYVEVRYAGSSDVDGRKAGVTLDDYYNGRLSVSNSTFADNAGYGLVAEGTEITGFAGNTFSGNAAASLLISPNSGHYLDAASVYDAGNGANVAEIAGGDLDASVGSPSWADIGVPYRVVDDMDILADWTIEAGADLEFAADVFLRIEDTNQSTTAKITAVGTSTAPITFTGVTKTAGFWRGILIESGNANVMDYVEIRHGGSSTLDGVTANLVLDAYYNGVLDLDNSLVGDSAGWGAVIETDGDIGWSNNTFPNTPSGDIQVR